MNVKAMLMLPFDWNDIRKEGYSPDNSCIILYATFTIYRLGTKTILKMIYFILLAKLVRTFEIEKCEYSFLILFKSYWPNIL